MYHGATLKVAVERCGIARLKSKPLLNISGRVIIGNNFIAGQSLRIEVFSEYLSQKFKPELYIGNNVSFEDYCHIGCVNKITIGDGCLFASNVFISDHSHGESKLTINRPALRELTSKGGIVIGKNVWIGEQTCILSGSTVGDNCIIGAGSIVNSSFPDNVIIAGVPAKIIKTIH